MAKKFGKGKVWRIWGPLLVIFLVATAAFECNKTSGLNSNFAYLSVIHTAQDRDYIVVKQEKGDSLSSILDSTVSYGRTSGFATDTASPYVFTSGYVDVGVGVKPVEIFEGTNTTPVSSGKTTFNNGRYYSMFLYNDSPATTTLPLLILPDNIVTSVDTFAYLRWMNFSPNTYYDFIINSLRPDSSITGAIYDTIPSGFLNFVGNNEKISIYPFKRVHTGNYQVLVYYDIDSTTRLPNKYYTLTDSLNLVRDKSYTAFVQGYINGTGEKKLRLRVVQHN